MVRGSPNYRRKFEYFINLYLQHRKLVNDYLDLNLMKIEYIVGDDIETLHRFINIQSSKKDTLTLENAGDKWSDYQILDNLIGKGKRTTALYWCMKAGQVIKIYWIIGNQQLLEIYLEILK